MVSDSEWAVRAGSVVVDQLVGALEIVVVASRSGGDSGDWRLLIFQSKWHPTNLQPIQNLARLEIETDQEANPAPYQESNQPILHCRPTQQPLVPLLSSKSLPTATQPDFTPLFRSPHVLTILGNYWPRDYDFARFQPAETRYIATEPGVQVLVETQRPLAPRAELVLLHGLEGSGKSGYMISMAHRALMAGFTVHRFHMRSCGGTEHLCPTLYHAGLTSDLLSFISQIRAVRFFLIGFSLGGNVALKAAAEAPELIAGVATVSAAIDLAASAKALQRPENRLYENRFVARMKQRLMRTGRYRLEDLAPCRTVYDIDDRVTAPSFGFGTADRYYETQSALRFVQGIDVPVLMIAAQDDPLIPYVSYLDAAVRANPYIEIIAPRSGGHLGFLSRKPPRFWADETVIDWIEARLQQGANGNEIRAPMP